MEILLLPLFVALPAFSALTPLVNRLGTSARARGYVQYWSFAGVLIPLGAAALLLLRGIPPQTILLGVLAIDSFAIFLAFTFLLIASFIIVASFDYMKDNPNLDSYYGLLLLATFGMIMVGFAVDLIALYLAWELMSIPTYVLAGIDKKDPASNEAAVKYFILSALSSALIVYAISLAYGITGTTNLFLVAGRLSSALRVYQPLALLSTILFTAGFGMKVGAVPFHMWVPDAYEGAPITIGGFLAAGTKNGGFAALLRVFALGFVALRLDWSATFAILAVLTMTLGNVAALMQKSFTRLLAYSSIAHAGYILIGLAAPSPLGLSGALFHMLNHGIMKSLAFIGAAAVFRKISTTSLDSYAGLGARMPITAFTLTIALLGLAGVPPLNGFMSKLVLFTAAVDGNLAWLAVAGVLNSAFSLAYYGWIVKRMYFDDAGGSSTRLQESPSFIFASTFAAFLIVLTGVLPEPILDLTRRIASEL